MRLVLGRDAEVAAWAAERVAHMAGESFGPCVAMGIVSEAGEPLGAVVYHAYRPTYRTIEISFATSTPRCLTRRLIKALLSYPFGQLDCVRVTAVTPRSARPARRFLEHFGFKREGLVRKGFGADDAVIYGLLKREWLSSKWMRTRSAHEVAAEAAPGA